MNNPYEDLYEHIKIFVEQVAYEDDDDWVELITSIKKMVLLKQINSYKKAHKNQQQSISSAVFVILFSVLAVCGHHHGGAGRLHGAVGHWGWYFRAQGLPLRLKRRDG